MRRTKNSARREREESDAATKGSSLGENDGPEADAVVYVNAGGLAVVPVMLCFLQVPIDQGAEMREAFMSIETGFSTYSEGMTLAAKNAEPGDFGACRRR
jgi:hypothetical protein